MIEPGVRYLPHVPLPAPHHHHSLHHHHNHHDDLHHHHHHHLSLEAAVDLTKKSAAEDWRPRSPPDAADDDGGVGEDNDSDSDTPLDMSVTSRLTPVFPGFQRDLSPARSDRSAPGGGGEPHLQVRLTGLYSPGGVREWSAERGGSDVDKGQSLI